MYMYPTCNYPSTCFVHNLPTIPISVCTSSVVGLKTYITQALLIIISPATFNLLLKSIPHPAHFCLPLPPFTPSLPAQDLLPMCYRCSTTNQLFNNAGATCTNCRQPFVFSFVSFGECYMYVIMYCSPRLNVSLLTTVFSNFDSLYIYSTCCKNDTTTLYQI